MDALKELLGSNNSISLDINVILSVLFFDTISQRLKAEVCL